MSTAEPQFNDPPRYFHQYPLLSLATGQGVPRAPRPRVLLSLANPRYAFRLVGLLIDVIFPTGKQDSSPW